MSKNIVINIINTNVTQKLKNFKIFDTLPEILNSKVKFYHQIYRFNRYSGIFVMNDNKVYGIGFNYFGALGLGHERHVSEYTLIEELCDQNIEEFFGGKCYMFARNDKNQIYSWGYNDRYEWVNENSEDDEERSEECLKPKRIIFFENKNIIEISCGYDHFLGLTEDGIIYGWGNNYFGQTGSRSDNGKELTPIRVQLSDCLDNRIKFIHCSENTSCAVTVDGRAYFWGMVNGRITVSPQLIKTNVSKMYLNCDEYYSILNMKNGDFKIREMKEKKILWFKFKKSILKTKGVSDIYGLEIFLKDNSVYEINVENKTLGKTNYSNFYEYFLYEKKRTIETIHITSDGYLMRPKLELNEKHERKSFEENYLSIFLIKNMKIVLRLSKNRRGCIWSCQ